MDFTKFVSMMQNEALFFAKANLMSDLLEGQYPPSEKNSEYYKIMIEHYSTIKEIICINCWHINDYEAAAMWKLYTNSKDGVAIQSTFQKLADSFNVTSEHVIIGKVKYIDYQTDYIESKSLVENVLPPFFYKRHSFNYEHELRAIVMHHPIDDEDEFDDKIV